MSNEPVLVGNIVTILFTLFGAWFAKNGISQDNLSDVIVAIVSVILAISSIVKQRSSVTPLVNPRDNEGNALVPLEEAA